MHLTRGMRKFVTDFKSRLTQLRLFICFLSFLIGVYKLFSLSNCKSLGVSSVSFESWSSAVLCTFCRVTAHVDCIKPSILIWRLFTVQFSGNQGCWLFLKTTYHQIYLCRLQYRIKNSPFTKDSCPCLDIKVIMYCSCGRL